MNPERTRAYRRVIHTLDELGPSKLHDEEKDVLREAADTLIFTQEPLDGDALGALSDTERLCRALVDSGRWQELTAMRLADDVAGCGPERPGELRAA
jgi:hypothetical protein